MADARVVTYEIFLLVLPEMFLSAAARPHPRSNQLMELI